MAGMSQSLSEFAVATKRTILADLLAGQAPQGEFEAENLRRATTKGTPQMGTIRYEPHALVFEFIFPDPASSPTILEVRIASPQRIVYLPVPGWVVESIWEGDVAGSFHFESDAKALLQEIIDCMTPQENPQIFGVKHLSGRRGA